MVILVRADAAFPPRSRPILLARWVN